MASAAGITATLSVTLLLLTSTACAPERSVEASLPERASEAVELRGEETPFKLQQHARLQLMPGAPEAYEDSLLAIGAAYVVPPRGRRPARIGASREVLREIAGLRWVRILSVDSLTRLRPTAQTVPWGADTIGARYVKATHGYSGSGIKVLVIDNGVACSHPDLTVWGGYDFWAHSSTYCGVDGVHGTKAAGVIAALDNGSYSVGVAPGAKIYMARVCNGDDCSPTYAIQALEWALDHDMDVVSMSLADCGAGTPDIDWILAVQDLYAAGVPVVVGHGANSDCGQFADPSNYASGGAIVVAAHYINRAAHTAHQYGDHVMFSGPSSVLTLSVAGDTVTFNGVSSAVPHVAGLYALLRSAGFSGVANMTSRIANTAIDWGDSGQDDYFGFGLIRANPAVVPPPSITNLTWCTNGSIEEYGDCSMTAVTSYGAGALSVRFVAYFSNSPGDSTVYNWGLATRDIYVPAGDYELTIKTHVKDAHNRFAAIVNTWNIPVCTGEAFAECETQ